MDEEAAPDRPKRKRNQRRVKASRHVKAVDSGVVDPHNPMPVGRKGPLGRTLDPATKHACLVTLLGVIDKDKSRGRLTKAVRAMARRYGCHEMTVWRMLGPYRRSTTKAATRLLQVSAFDMAQKVVAEGSPSELIDVLSRPNIGVLDPAKKVGGDAGSGLFISVQIGSCGAMSPTVTAARGEITDGEILEQATGGEGSAAWGGSDGEPTLAR